MKLRSFTQLMGQLNNRNLGHCFILALAILLVLPLCALAQGAAPAAGAGTAKVSAALEASIEKRVEKFLRNVSAWGPGFQMQVGPVNTSMSPDLYEVLIKVSAGGQSEGAVVYVSKDGKYIFSGEIADLDINPLNENRDAMHLQGFGSKGPADAKVTVVEYGDLECPDCRQYETVLRVLLPRYPQVRFVFKDFPLESIHPWAMAAAIAGHCVFQQNQDAFWKFHDSVYDNQSQVAPENAAAKLAEFATTAGADPGKYQACIADPKSADFVKASITEGRSLKVSGTPTTFVNGRRMVGPDGNTLQQFIEYDLNNAN